MVTQSAVAATTNGVVSNAKLNGKNIKSKNQLRRLKAKEKKTAQTGGRTIVRVDAGS
jgi:splicing factor 3B subunit 2